MEKRILKKSGIEVPVICLGCFAFGGVNWGKDVKDDESLATIQLALERGVNFLDTAASYGKGHSEELIARVIDGQRHKVILATKVFPGKQTESEIRDSLEGSLRRLETDYIDLYYIHLPNPHDADANMRMLEVMEKLRGQNKIRAIGVSNFNLAQLKSGIAVAPISAFQPPYSLLWRYIEKEIMPFCREHDISVCAYSPLAQGLLTGKFCLDIKFGNDDIRHRSILFNEDHLTASLKVAEVVREVATARNKSPDQVAVNWVIQQEGIASAIVGAKRPAQFEESLGAIGWSLTIEEIEKLNIASDEAHRLRPEAPPGLWMWVNNPDLYRR